MSEKISFSPWREVLIENIAEYYPPEQKTHGFGHAKEVEKLSLEISQEPEYNHLSLDINVLSAGALLHDAGYSQKDKGWSIDLREHVYEGMKIAHNSLPKIPLFAENPGKIREVEWLILNHDNTNYSFPIKGRGGSPAINRSFVAESEGAMNANEELSALLSILKEADSRLGTGTKGAERTLNFNLKQSLPLFARGDPLRAWMWGESAIGSVRLAAKRAILDARTQKGKEIAWQGYLGAEKLIEKECVRNGLLYQPELGLEEFRSIKEEDISGDLEIIRVHPWEELEGVLRQVSLSGDPTLFPYVTASIESRALEVREVHPLSLYALSDKVEFHKRLRELFLANYALDLLDLSGIIEFRTGGKDHVIAPPLVEISALDNNKVLLVDGIHRFLMAPEVNISKVRSIVISNVPNHFPLLPLPLLWEDIKFYEDVPPQTKKRRFRFPDLESFPDISSFSDVEVNEKNYLYFFYRNLEHLGSSGIREPSK